MRFNTRITNANVKHQIENHPDLQTNYEDGIAFKLDTRTELYQRVGTCLFGEDRFYETGKEQEQAISNLINQISLTDPEFILQLAVYARNKLYLRTVPIYLLVQAALLSPCKEFVRKYTPKIIQRADELTECISAFIRECGDVGDKRDKGSLPACLKKGIADSFTLGKFDEYQLSKYDRNNSSVKMLDVMRLTHPKPKSEEQQILFRKIRQNELVTPQTWETYISKFGSSKESWEHIIPTMGIMAIIRNLRNFLQKNVSDEIIDKYVIAKLTDVQTIKKSKQFPFRFLAAYRELETIDVRSEKCLEALEQAMDISVNNLPVLEGRTALFADNSGSMCNNLSSKSKMRLNDIANTMLAIAHKMSQDSVIGTFANYMMIINLLQRNGVLNNAQKIGMVDVGGATNTYLCLQHLRENKIWVDRILIFTDEQSYDIYGYDNSVAEELKLYKIEVNPNVFFYNINLAGYGTTQTPQNEPRTCLISGWTERILEYIKMFEDISSSSSSNLNIIEKIKRDYE